MRFNGQQQLSVPIEQARAKLGDAGFLTGSIPDSTPAEGPTPERAGCTVRPGFSFVRGAIDVELRRGAAPENEIHYAVTSKGIGSSAEVAARMTLAASEAGTLVEWSAEVTRLGGLLKLAPTGLMQAAAQKVIGDVWQGIRARLDAH